MTQTDYNSVSQAIRDKYANGGQGINTTVHKGTFGTYVTDHDSPELSYILPDKITSDQTSSMLLEAGSHIDSPSVRVYLDGQTSDRELHAPLINAGFTLNCQLVYLAYRGTPPNSQPDPALTIEPMTDKNAVDYYTAWCKGFSDSENEPTPEETEEDVVSLIQEMEGGNSYLIGRVKGDAATIAGWYEGPDRLIFHLATRLPYRNQGHAKRILSYIISDTFQTGRQSVTIFTDPNDTPVEFYRRMGFTEEVYRQIRYTI
jgi:ribosomal protein S18 acetylase RimI-like enzyme